MVCHVSNSLLLTLVVLLKDYRLTMMQFSPVDHAWVNFCNQHGVHRTYSSPYTPTENSITERHWRMLNESGRCMLHESGLSEGFWERAWKTANYIHNRYMCIRVCSAHPMKSLQANSLICPISGSLDAGLMSWFHCSSERSGKLPPLMDYMLGILPITEPL